MKHNLLAIFYAFFGLTSVATAQIVLTQGSYPAYLPGADSLKMTTYTSAFPSLTPLTDGMWDMSTITDSIPVFYAWHMPVSAYKYEDSNVYALGHWGYQGRAQFTIAATGIQEIGIKLKKNSYGLGTLTFNTTDSLII